MITIAVPFYGDRNVDDSPRADDAVFDHPTALGDEPTLPRLLRSLDRLVLPAGQPISLCVVVGHTTKEVASEADAWASQLLGDWQTPAGIKHDPMDGDPNIDCVLID